jgi:hypothetical protein
MALDVSCLYSTVKNTSGGRKKFGFLPPHGRELASGEEFTLFGHVTEAMIRFERTEARRNIVALENALRRGDLEILDTPAPLLQDYGGDTVHAKMLKLQGGTLSLVDPCWNTSTSANPTPV